MKFLVGDVLLLRKRYANLTEFVTLMLVIITFAWAHICFLQVLTIITFRQLAHQKAGGSRHGSLQSQLCTTPTIFLKLLRGDVKIVCRFPPMIYRTVWVLAGAKKTCALFEKYQIRLGRELIFFSGWVAVTGTTTKKNSEKW